MKEKYKIMWECIEEKEVLNPEKRIDFLEEKVELLKEVIDSHEHRFDWIDIKERIEKTDYSKKPEGRRTIGFKNDSTYVVVLAAMIVIAYIVLMCLTMAGI